ncbi:MAG: hypothetical protein AAF438_22360, partial [Pseudomonadota bacterium]
MAIPPAAPKPPTTSFRALLLALVCLALIATTPAAYLAAAVDAEGPRSKPMTEDVSTQLGSDFFINLLTLSDSQAIKTAFEQIEQQWDSSYIPMLIEVSIFAGSDYTSDSVFATLAKMTGKQFGPHTRIWQDWLWNRTEIISPDYVEFKADLYRQI